MKKRKSFEAAILDSYAKGRLRSAAPSRAELKRYQAAAAAAFVKDRRVKIRLAPPDLMDIRARAAEEGMPYQTLIASVLHKFVAGRFVEKPARATGRGRKRRARAA